MKPGSKSNLISAYCALFTVAAGMLIYDYVRRASANPQPEAAQKPTQQRLIADTGKAASQPVR